MKKYHYFYRIVNKINNHFYYGVHSTNDLNDGYMGSGTKLHTAFKKYGIENFTKEILLFFDNTEEAYEYEEKMVNEEMVKSKDCYNVQLGGKSINTTGLRMVKDKNGNRFMVDKDNPQIGKELESVSSLSGKVVVKRKKTTEEYFAIDKATYEENKDLYDTTWSGRRHLDETKNKIRKTLTPQNSKNKRIWVNKNGIVKYLDKRNLNEYLDNGWKLGRTGYKPRKGCRGKKIET